MFGVFYINLFSITTTESTHHMHLISYPPTSFIYGFRVSQLRLWRAELDLRGSTLPLCQCRAGPKPGDNCKRCIMFGLLSSLTNLNDWFSCQTSSLQTILLLADSYRTTEQPTAPTEYWIIYESLRFYFTAQNTVNLKVVFVKEKV